MSQILCLVDNIGEEETKSKDLSQLFSSVSFRLRDCTQTIRGREGQKRGTVMYSFVLLQGGQSDCFGGDQRNKLIFR